MNSFTGKPAFRNRQQGAALVIGLILLMVLTLLAVSGMNTATLELQMAGNAQFGNNAFQAAETGIEIAMQADELNTNAPTTIPVTDVPGTPSDQYTTTTRYNLDNGQTLAWNYSTDFAAYHFDVTSTGTSARNATATHTQSFFIVAQATPE